MTELMNTQFAGLKAKFHAGEISSRQGAFDYFQQRGLPSRKSEDWKYTSLQSLEKTEYVLPETEMTDQDKEKIQKALGPDFFHLVFFNGEFQGSISNTIPGFKIENLSLKAENFEDSLMALNWAMALNPIRIKISDNTTVGKPVQILFYSSAVRPQITFPHVEISVGKASVVSFLEDYVGQGASVTNAFVKVIAEKDSRISYIHCQEQDAAATHLARTHFDVQKDAHVESLSFSIGAKLSRHTQKISLKETGAFIRSLGLYVTSGEQHSDHTGLIDHEVGGCTSYQIYKGLLKDQSRAVFNGKVLIRKDSQKAFSEQSNKNLLLTTGAEIDSKPQLEILADDVQARHGSTVGQLNKEELFYLNSRGISSEKAIPMLSFGFLSEILYQLTDDQMMSWLKTKLQKTLADLRMGGT